MAERVQSGAVALAWGDLGEGPRASLRDGQLLRDVHEAYRAGRVVEHARTEGRVLVRVDIYTLNQFDETTAHASGTGDLTRLCALVACGRLDGQVELQSSWREPTPAVDAILHRRIGGKAVLDVD